MKKITAIIKTSKEDLYDVFLDNELFMTCNIDIVTKHRLKVDRLVDEEEQNVLVEENDLKRAFNDALRHLSYKRRTKAEIQSQLKGFEERIVSATIDRLLDYRLIDDGEYGKDYVISRGSQLKGRRLIERSLVAKGLENEVIAASLKELSEEDELKNAEKIAHSFFMSKQNLPINQIKQKLSQKLIAKGYSWDIIERTIENLVRNEEIQRIIVQQEDIYFQQAKAAAEKLLAKHSRNQPDKFQISYKIKASLYQKGFEENCIKRVIEELL